MKDEPNGGQEIENREINLKSLGTRWVFVVVAQWFSRVQLFVTPWTVAHQAPLSMDFSRQEYWSELPFPSPDYVGKKTNKFFQ